MNRVKAHANVKKTANAITPLLIIAVLILVFCTVMKVDLLAHKQINEDEFMHLQWSWAMTHGQVPYRDFMMVHTPLPQVVLAPFTLVFKDDTAIIFYARVLFALFSIAALFFWYFLARRLFSQDAAIFTVVFAASVAVYAQKSVEVRPDQLAALFGVVVLWLLAKSKPKVALAGLAAGLAVVTNQKFVPIAALVAVGGFWAFGENTRERMRFLLRFSAGAAVPLLIFLIYLTATGSLAGFIRDNYHMYVFGGNLGSEAGGSMNAGRFMISLEFLLGNLTFVLMALWGLIQTFRQKAFLQNQKRIIPALCYLLALCLLYFFSFAHERQIYLYLAPVLALFAGYGATDLLAKGTRSLSKNARNVAVAALVLVVAAPSLLGQLKIDRDNAGQIQTWKWILQTVPPDQPVMDGHAGMYVYRKNAMFFYCVGFVEAKPVFDSFFQNDEQASRFVINALKRQNVKLVLLEDVFEQTLPPMAVSYIKKNYRLSLGHTVPIYLSD